MKIYTRTGDDGQSALFGGTRVSKADVRLEAYGTVDELCAAVGWAAVVADAELRGRLAAVQADLFVVGSHLATPADASAAAKKALPPIDPAAAEALETQIDTAEEGLPKLTSFILPGGGESAARLHVARTVCRRAERCVVALAAGETVDAAIIVYLNRLSDWLFVQARAANARAGIDDVAWRARHRT